MLRALAMTLAPFLVGEAPLDPRPGSPPARVVALDKGVRVAWSGGLESVSTDGSGLEVPGAAHLELPAGARALVQWTGMGSLRLHGPASLEWEAPAEGTSELSCRLFHADRVYVDVRRRGMVLDLPRGWTIDLDEAAGFLAAHPDGDWSFHLDAGRPALLSGEAAPGSDELRRLVLPGARLRLSASQRLRSATPGRLVAAPPLEAVPSGTPLAEPVAPDDGLAGATREDPSPIHELRPPPAPVLDLPERDDPSPGLPTRSFPAEEAPATRAPADDADSPAVDVEDGLPPADRDWGAARLPLRPDRSPGSPRPVEPVPPTTFLRGAELGAHLVLGTRIGAPRRGTRTELPVDRSPRGELELFRYGVRRRPAEPGGTWPDGGRGR